MPEQPAEVVAPAEALLSAGRSCARSVVGASQLTAARSTCGRPPPAELDAKLSATGAPARPETGPHVAASTAGERPVPGLDPGRGVSHSTHVTLMAASLTVAVLSAACFAAVVLAVFAAAPRSCRSRPVAGREVHPRGQGSRRLHLRDPPDRRGGRGAPRHVPGRARGLAALRPAYGRIQGGRGAGRGPGPGLRSTARPRPPTAASPRSTCGTTGRWRLTARSTRDAGC